MATGIVERVSEKVSFATKVPMLMKATADNDSPTPGYLYQEINKITLESFSNCHLLLDFLSDRLKKSSPHVKYKALKIMTYVSANGQSEFRSALRHKNQHIRDASNFSGPMDALQGDALNQKVRKAATELIELLFNVENPESSQQSFLMSGPSGQKMEGFGNTPITSTSKSGGFMNKVKGLSSHIPSLGGYLKTGSREDFITGEVDVGNRQFVSFGEVPSTSSSFDSPSRIEFVNYSENKWSPHKEGSHEKVAEYKLSILTNDEKPEDNEDDEYDEHDHDDDCDDHDDNDDDYGTVENQLVDKITEEGGIRAVPSKESLEQFTQRCSTLNLVKILKLLNTRMEDPSLDVQMKCLFALEHLLRSTIPNVASKVLEYINLQQLIESDSSKIKSKANKVLYIAKSKKGSSEKSVRVKKKEEKPMPATSSLPTCVQLFTDDQKLDSNLDLLGSGSLDNCHMEQNESDLFHGLQIHQRHQDIQVKSRDETNQSVNSELSDLQVKSRAKSNQSSAIDDLSGLDLMGISSDEMTLKGNSPDRKKSLETFDPLDMGFDSKQGSSKESSSLDDFLNFDDVHASSTLLPRQGHSSSSLIQPVSSSSSSSSSSILNLQSTTTTHQSPIVGRPKNSSFEESSSLLNNLNDLNQDVKTSTGQKLHGQKMGQSSLSSDDLFDLEALGNSSCLTGLPSQTGKFSLSDQSVGQPINQVGVSGHSGIKCLETGLRGQLGFTGQSGFTGISGIHGNAVSTSSTRFPSLIGPNPNHTIPLNLSKPTNQKSDFDFLSKPKRESAFSFVQDEMRASKK